MQKMLSFVIPCYRSELTVGGVISEIHDKMSERPELDYEIVAVNDCSPDGVYDVLRTLSEDDPKIKVMDLAKNGGKHAAMMAGYSVAKGDYIVNLDDDGQCPLDKLWELMEPLYEGYDISIARYPKKKQSALKNFGSKMNGAMAHYLIDKPKSLQTSNFSVLKRFVMEEMRSYKNPYPYISGLMLRTTSKITNVDMEERERTAGVGHYTFKKSLALWINGFTAFSVKPLRISMVLGALCALCGFVFGLFTIIRKIINPDILMGYSSLMAVLLFVGGIIMMMLGMIGEYIGRIYICINNSPQYVIRETININDADDKAAVNIN